MTAGQDDRRFGVGSEIRSQVQAPTLQVRIPGRVVVEYQDTRRVADAGLPLRPTGDVVYPRAELGKVSRPQVAREVQAGHLGRIVVERLATQGNRLLPFLLRIDIAIVESGEVVARQLDAELVIVGLPGQTPLQLPGELVRAPLVERGRGEGAARGQDIGSLAGRGLLAQTGREREVHSRVVDRRSRDEVDHAVGRVWSVQRRSRSKHDLRPLDIRVRCRIGPRDVHAQRGNTRDPEVRHRQGRAGEHVVEAANDRVAALQAGGHEVHPGFFLHVVGGRDRGSLGDVLPGDHLYGGWRVQGLLDLPGRRHRNRVQIEATLHHRHAQVRRLARADRDVTLLHDRPAGQREAHQIGAGRDLRDPVGTTGGGEPTLDQGAVDQVHLHLHRREPDAALAIGDGTGESTLLGRCWQGC